MTQQHSRAFIDRNGRILFTYSGPKGFRRAFSQLLNDDEVHENLRLSQVRFPIFWDRGKGEYGPDLSGLNINNISLEEASLEKINLSDSVLPQAHLEEANLGEANLTGAKLFQSDLRKANLAAADLTNALFKGVDLRGAQGLDHAILQGTAFPSSRLDLKTLKDIFWNPHLEETNLIGAWLELQNKEIRLTEEILMALYYMKDLKEEAARESKTGLRKMPSKGIADICRIMAPSV